MADANLQGIVADVMVTIPKTLPLRTTVRQARAAFDDPHVHMLLLTRDGILHGALERTDLDESVAPDVPALDLASLGDRTIGSRRSGAVAHRAMVSGGRRRLAVIDAGNELVGLLCLKRDRTGFCSDSGVLSRARARHRGGSGAQDGPEGVEDAGVFDGGRHGLVVARRDAPHGFAQDLPRAGLG